MRRNGRYLTPAAWDPSLRLAIDSLDVEGDRFTVAGWLFHAERRIEGVTVSLLQPGGVMTFDATYGLPREDVARNYPGADAKRSGFHAAGSLRRGGEPFSLAVALTFADGETVSRMLIRHDPGRVRPTGERSMMVGGVRVSAGLVRKALGALRRGEWRFVVQRIHEELRRRSSSAVTLADLFAVMDGARPRRRKPHVARFRAVLGVAAVASPRGMTVVFDHAMGGGANRYRDDLVAASSASGVLVVTAVPTDPRLLVRVVAGADEAQLAAPGVADVAQLLSRVGCRRIILNDLVSFPDPLAIIDLAVRLRASRAIDLDVAVHDYLAVCPSWALLDDRGSFCGVPSLDRCHECLPVNPWVQADGSFRDIGSWRDAWRQCFEAATRIVAFSRSSVDLLGRAYPGVRDRISVEPHALDDPVPRRAHVDVDAPLHIGVVGSIGYHKGRGVIAAIADHVLERGLAVPITVIGTIDGAVPPGVRVTGPYIRDDLPELVEASGANAFLFPSICPETFSYVCEELMALEVPLAVFDVGAPPERVRGYDRGVVLASRRPADVIAALDGLLRRARSRESPRRATR